MGPFLTHLTKIQNAKLLSPQFLGHTLLEVQSGNSIACSATCRFEQNSSKDNSPSLLIITELKYLTIDTWPGPEKAAALDSEHSAAMPKTHQRNIE